MGALFQQISTFAVLYFYKNPRCLTLIIQKKYGIAHNDHGESLDLPVLMGSSCIPLRSSARKSINGCLTLAGTLCTHSCSFTAPASCQHQLQSFFSAGLAAASVPLLQPVLHRDSSEVLATELKEIPAAEEIPCQTRGAKD